MGINTHPAAHVETATGFVACACVGQHACIPDHVCQLFCQSPSCRHVEQSSILLPLFHNLGGAAVLCWHVQDLQTGKELMQPIPMTSGDVVWANDNATLVRAAQPTTTQHHLPVHTTGVALVIVTSRAAKLQPVFTSTLHSMLDSLHPALSVHVGLGVSAT